MTDKPQTRFGYDENQTKLAHATCLYLATVLGDYLEDLVVVGGLVPSLLIDQAGPDDDPSRHVGTMDLDLGLALAIRDQGRYHELASRLRGAGLRPDQKADTGAKVSQRWKTDLGGPAITVDFLMAPPAGGAAPGELIHLESDFATIAVPALHLAFQDRRLVSLQGRTLKNELAQRSLWVCGPGAFVVLKALAFGNRGEPKDAYDLFYLTKHYGAGLDDIAVSLRPLLSDPAARQALEVLSRDFTAEAAPGPSRAASFIHGTAHPDTEADVAGLVRQLLKLLEVVD
jgi:hypothetical protein